MARVVAGVHTRDEPNNSRANGVSTLDGYGSSSSDMAATYGERELDAFTHPIFMRSAPARTLCTVHLASLQLLFFISVATTAPR